MRNLKRLLTMVMAIAMMMSLMVVGAGATSFKDDKDITHKDAVQKMVSLNIINGRDNGNFDPSGIVTRAEMCKMICIAMNGGNDPKLSASSVATATFTDTKGHWAAGYIEYCVNMGIVAGLGDKTFGPDQKVTPTQAAKMLLVALGYDAAYEKFTGPTWALATNKLAQGPKGLYDEIMSIDPNAPMTRDAAAQMVYNFCYANMVKYEFGISGTGTGVTGVKQANDIILATDSNGKITYQTILNKYYKLVTVKGTLVKMEYDKVKKEYGYKIVDQSGSSDVIKGTFYSATDYSASFGMKVELLYKDKGDAGYNRNDDTIYDITADGSKLIAEGYAGDFGATSTFANHKELKFNGKYYDIETSGSLYSYEFVTGNRLTNAFTGSTADLMVTGELGSKVRLLDVDNNGKVDKIIVTPFNVQKVSYIGSDNTTVTGAIGNNKNADITTYTGIAKDDRVVATLGKYSITGMPTFVKATIAEGKITATKGSPVSDYKIGDNWYSKVGNVNTVSINDTIEYVAFGGELFYAKVKEPGTTSKEVAVVVNVGTTNSTGADSLKPEATLMFTDGTKKTVIISKINGADAVVGNGSKDGNLAKTNYALDERVGELVTYVKDSDNYYELTDLATPNKTPSGTDLGTASFAGFDGTGTNATYVGKKVGNYTLADDAVIFVVKKSTTNTIKNNDVKTYTGKELKNSYDANSSTFGNWNTVGAAVLYKEVNGFNYGKVAVINANDFPDVNSSSNYGYLVGDVEQIYSNSKNYLGFPIWNGKETKTVYEETTNSTKAALKKGSVISFDFDGTTTNISSGSTSTVVKNVIVPGVVTDAITGWDDSKTTGDIAFSKGATSKVDSDTVVIFIDSKNTCAPKDGATYSISKANDINGDGNVTVADANARYLLGTSAVKLLLVDVSDNMKPAPTTGTASVRAEDIQTDAQLQHIFATSNTVNVTSSTYAPTENVVVKSGKTLNVKSIDTAKKITVENGATLNIAGNVTGGAVIEVNGTASVQTLTSTAAFTGTGALTVSNDVDVAANTTISTANVTVGKLTVANATTLTVNGTLNVTGTLTATGSIAGTGTVNLTAAQYLANIAKVTTDKIVVTGEVAYDTVAIAKDVTVNGAVTVKAGATLTVTGKLTATGAVTVTGTAIDGAGTITAASYSDYSKVSTANVVVTGDVTAATALYAGACNYTFKGNVTDKLTLNAASKVVFEKSVDITKVIPTGVAGATVKFMVAPTATTFVAANTADGFFVNTATVLDVVTKISTDKVYTYTANAGGGTHAGWVTP